MAKGPKVSHVSYGDEARAIRKVITNFTDAMQLTANRMINSREIGKEELGIDNSQINGEKLLNLRKKLVQAIKSGMLDKNDMEPEIAVYAATIWFMRLEKDRRDRIVNEWS